MEQTVDNNKIRVLLVESNSARLPIGQSLLFQMEGPEFDIIHVEGGETVWQHLAEQHIDIILLDLTVPNGIGLDILSRMHTHVPEVPIVVLTDNDEPLAARAIQMGAQDYLLKERLDSESLLHALLCSVQRQRMRLQLREYTRELQDNEARFRKLILNNADGILVVDIQGTIRFINPTIENMFGRTSEELLGESFGFPPFTSETQEIDILPRGTDTPGVAEMRVVETEWEGDNAYLVSLRDITAHKKLEDDLREAEQFNLAILNSIDEHIAVVDENGFIILANEFWMDVARSHNNDPALDSTTHGGNFFAACRQAFGETSSLIEGMQEVLRGTTETFELEYPYQEKGKETRWFQVRVRPMVDKRQRHIVVCHTDITERKRALQAEATAAASAEQIKTREREIRGLLELAHATSTTITASVFGILPLRKSSPHVFDELLRQYENSIEHAIEQRAYRVEHDISAELRALAERLGFLRAGPRDVIEIHSNALQSKSKDTTPLKVQAYTEEGRLLVLELMGYLVSYYRNHSLGISKSLLHEWYNTKQSVEQEKK
jgi:PAS domain-containing protein